MLSSGEQALDRVQVIYMEVFFERLYEDAWIFGETNEFLSGHGFKLCGLSNIVPAADGDLGQANATFRKRRIMHVLIIAFLSLMLANADAATLAGQQVQPGGRIEIRFPVSKYFQDIASQAGNPRPETGRAVVAFPAGFDPSRPWPILIVTSTSDFNRTSAMDVDWYRKPATAEGWIVLGSDATVAPRIDSTQWRLGLLGAALEAMRKEWPQSARWPIAFAGFSGGSKRSGVLGAMLAKSGAARVCGFFLSGINEDRLGESYRTYQPGRGLLEVPVWLSSGAEDPIATPADHNRVKASLERIGFKRVRLEQFSGGHQLKLSEVRRALQWFRELGRF